MLCRASAGVQQRPVRGLEGRPLAAIRVCSAAVAADAVASLLFRLFPKPPPPPARLRDTKSCNRSTATPRHAFSARSPRSPPLLPLCHRESSRSRSARSRSASAAALPDRCVPGHRRSHSRVEKATPKRAQRRNAPLQPPLPPCSSAPLGLGSPAPPLLTRPPPFSPRFHGQLGRARFYVARLELRASPASPGAPAQSRCGRGNFPYPFSPPLPGLR